MPDPTTSPKELTLNLTPADLAFVLDAFERRGLFYTAKTAPEGRRRVVVEATMGYHDASRLAALLGATEPRKRDTKWRVRLKGENAEALLRDLMPHFSESSQGYAEATLSKIDVMRAKIAAARKAREAAA